MPEPVEDALIQTTTKWYQVATALKFHWKLFDKGYNITFDCQSTGNCIIYKHILGELKMTDGAHTFSQLRNWLRERIERKEGTAETLESPPPLRLGLTLPVNTTWDAMLAGRRSVKTWNCEWVLMKQTPLDPHSHSVFSPQHDPKQFTSPVKEFYLLDTLTEPSTKEHTTVILRMLPPVNFWTAF